MPTINYDNIFDDLIVWMYENIDQPLRIKDIAERSGYSSWHLQRLFKNCKGITLANYVTQMKLEIAMSLLSSTNIKIYEVALSAGFSSQQCFCRRFNQFYGMTPGEARKMAFIHDSNSVTVHGIWTELLRKNFLRKSALNKISARVHMQEP